MYKKKKLLNLNADVSSQKLSLYSTYSPLCIKQRSGHRLLPVALKKKKKNLDPEKKST